MQLVQLYSDIVYYVQRRDDKARFLTAATATQLLLFLLGCN